MSADNILFTDIGTLEIECVATEEAPGGPRDRWRMEFQLRGAGAAQAVAPLPLPASFARAAERIERVFGARDAGVGPEESERLSRDLEKLLGSRSTWDTPVLRELFGVLWAGARRRRRSADHERLWLNLAGFCLRPGYGYPLDDWRVRQLWSLYDQGTQYRDDARNRAEWWTTWRRGARRCGRCRARWCACRPASPTRWRRRSRPACCCSCCGTLRRQLVPPQAGLTGAWMTPRLRMSTSPSTSRSTWASVL